MTQKRFVSWAAVSSLPQAKKISLSDQLSTNKQHVERWEGVLVEELVVPGESRSIVLFEDAARKMEAYAKLKELITKRAFDVFIYLDRSRLGRKASLSMSVIELCHEAGIITYATESPPTSLEPPERNFHNKIVGALESVMAQEEVSKIQHRHEMGMVARVKGGNFPGRIPYGWTVRYEVENEKPVQIVEVDEEAKTVIDRIYTLYLDHGASIKTITEMLTVEGWPQPRGDGWTLSAVTVIVNLAMRYAGIVELNVRSTKRPYVAAKSRWPALISEELAKKVLAERRKRVYAKRSVGRGVHLFSHLVRCRKCDKRMIARYGWRDNRDGTTTKRENYRCMTSSNPSHPKYQIDGGFLLESVRDAIAWLHSEENRKEILESYVDRSPAIRRGIQKAHAQLEKYEEAAQRADDAYVMGSMSVERYQRQVAKLDDARARVMADLQDYEAELEAEKFDALREQRLLEVAYEGLTMLECEDVAFANAWFRRHIIIWVDNDDLEKRVVVQYL